MDLLIGERVMLLTPDGEPFATVVGETHDAYFVRRDDGFTGWGPNGTWVVVKSPQLDQFIIPLQAHDMPIETASPHIAGISPERVDWDKVMHGKWELHE